MRDTSALLIGTAWSEGGLVKERGRLGASINYMSAPFPCLSIEQEIMSRRLAKLAPLAENLLDGHISAAV